MAEKKEKPFEERMAELEGVVKELESGKLSLDDSIGAFEKGIALTRDCEKMLEAAKAKVEKLVENAGGELAAEPFEPQE